MQQHGDGGDLDAAAAQAGLGAHQACYRWLPSWYPPLITVAFGGALLWILANSTSISRSDRTFLLIFALPALLAAVFSVRGWYYQLRRNRRLDLFEHGVILTRGRALRVVRYDSTVITQYLTRDQHHNDRSAEYRLIDVNEQNAHDPRPRRSHVQRHRTPSRMGPGGAAGD